MLAFPVDDHAMRIVGITLVALAVLAGATACKKSDTEDQSAPAATVPAVASPSSIPASAVVAGGSNSDPCALVTAAEVKSVTGVAFPKGAPTVGQVSYCKYQAGTNWVLVEAYPSGEAAIYQRAIRGAAGVAGGTVAKVSGIGDDAGYVDKAGTLCVHASTKNLCIVGPSRAADITMAKMALPRM
jgi:hypothetical protein